MASLATDFRRDRSIAVNDAHTITDDEAWAAFERRDRGWDGADHRRGQDHRHLLPAELPGAAAEAGECRILRRRRGRPRRRLPRLPALPARRGQSRGGRAGQGVRRAGGGGGGAVARRAGRRGRLFAAPFPPPVQARHRRDAGGLLPEPPGASGRRRRWPAMAGSPTRSTTPAIRGRAASMPTPRSRLGMTPSAWRDGGRGETIRWATRRDRSRHDAGRGDGQGHLPALLRRGRGGAAAALPQRGDRAWRRRRWPTWSRRTVAAVERAGEAARSAARRPAAPPSRRRSGAS